MVYYYSSQKSIFQKSEEKELELFSIKSLSEIYEKLKDEKVIALDTETNGLDPLTNKIVMLQFGTKDTQFVIDVRGIDITPLKPLFSKDILFVGHNLKFDYNMLKRHGIVLNKIYDTMLAEMVLENGKHSMGDIKKLSPFSLKTLTKKYLGIDTGKETREEFLYWGDIPFTLKQVTYGAKDVIFPLNIKEYQEKLIHRYELEKTVSLENNSSLALADIEYNGIYINSEDWLKANKQFQLDLKNILVELDKILITKEPKFESKIVQLDLFSNVMNNKHRRLTNVNWDSPVQVIKILTDIFNIHPLSKEGKLSSGSYALKMLDSNEPIVKALLKYRKKAKAVSSFGYKFLDKFQYEDKRIRTSFNSMVETGRVSSRKPNMQQIPKEDIFRNCFTSEEGNLLVTADYSNQEGRIMADKSNDEAYIDFFNNGDGDAHSFIARTLFSAAEGKPVDVRNDESHPNFHLRQKGKILNFFISFGGSAFTLSKTLRIPKEEAQYLIDNFYKGFPKLKEMFERDSEFALSKGYIRTNEITNRIRWIRYWKDYHELNQKNVRTLNSEELSKKGKLKGEIQRKGMNTPIQGTAGDMTKTALVLIRKKLIKNGISPLYNSVIRIVNVVHDEIILEAKKGFEDLAASILREGMEKAGSYYCKKVNMSAQPVISKYWRH